MGPLEAIMFVCVASTLMTLRVLETRPAPDLRTINTYVIGFALAVPVNTLLP